MTNESELIYSRDTVEFVTVAAEFCAYLEQSEGRERGECVDTLLKLLPLLYLKATLLPKVEGGEGVMLGEQVTEQDYEWIRAVVAAIMGPADEFLDLTPSDALYTDETRLQTLSENLADIYQPVRNFLATYRQGMEDEMGEALWALTDSFELYWGERVVDTLRALHRVKYSALPSVYDEGDNY